MSLNSNFVFLCFFGASILCLGCQNSVSRYHPKIDDPEFYVGENREGVSELIRVKASQDVAEHMKSSCFEAFVEFTKNVDPNLVDDLCDFDDSPQDQASLMHAMTGRVRSNLNKGSLNYFPYSRFYFDEYLILRDINDKRLVLRLIKSGKEVYDISGGEGLDRNSYSIGEIHVTAISYWL